MRKKYLKVTKVVCLTILWGWCLKGNGNYVNFTFYSFLVLLLLVLNAEFGLH